MVGHAPFDPKSVSYDDHMMSFQIGGGDSDGLGSDQGSNGEWHHYFRGSAPYQRGYGAHPLQVGAGIGDILRGLWRMLIPVVKKAGTAAGRELISTSERILNKVAEGENVKKAIVSEGKKGVKTLLEQGGLEPQFGSGIIGHKKRRRRPIKRGKRGRLPSHQIIVGRTANTKPLPAISNESFAQKRKRQRTDTFGLY